MFLRDTHVRYLILIVTAAEPRSSNQQDNSSDSMKTVTCINKFWIHLADCVLPCDATPASYHICSCFLIVLKI